MFKPILLASALTVAVSSAAEVMTLPAPRINYRTFTQSVTAAPKVSNPFAAHKQMAKAYKDELKAKKVDIIKLANGDTCLLAINKNGLLAMRNTRGKNVGADFASPWATELNLVKVNGDDKNYYYDGIAVVSDEKPENLLFIKSADGNRLTYGYSALCAFRIDDEVYFNTFSGKYSFFHIISANPGKSLPYQSSTTPYYYMSASDATTATDTVNGLPITLMTLPHGAYFGTVGGGRLYLDGSKSVAPRFANHYVNLENTGYSLTAYEKPDITMAATTGIVDGEEKTGTLLSINPPASDAFMLIALYGPDGRELLTNCQSVDFSEPDQMVYYKKRNDDRRILMGAMSLADTTLQLPPMFANVQRAVNAEGNGVWLVARKAFAPLEVYDPDADYTPVYRNKIEEDYNNRFYFNVTSALSFPKEPLSYEDLLLGLSAYTIEITDLMPDVEKVVAQYRTGVEPEGMNDENSSNRRNIRLLELKYPISELDEYCRRVVAEAPQEDKATAQRVASEAQATYNKANHLVKEDLENARRDYDELMAQRRIDKAKADALAAQRAQEAAMREAQLRAERQQAIALAFLNGLSNIMQSTMSSPSRSSGRGAAVSSGRTAAAMPSASSGNSGKVDNSSRKAFLKSQIIEWKNKAKKAEASYEQALSGGDDSWQKKNVIDSKRRSVDEALEMVRQYEAELNSLK